MLDVITYTPAILLNTAKENNMFPTSVNRAIKAFTIYRTGQYFSTSGSLLKGGLGTVDATAYLLGAGLQSSQYLRTMQDVITISKKRVETAAAGLWVYYSDLIDSNYSTEAADKFRAVTTLYFGNDALAPSGAFTAVEIADVYKELNKRAKKLNKPAVDQVFKELIRRNYMRLESE